MNLWIRMLAVLLRLIGKPRVAVMQVTRIHSRIWPNDLDIYGHVNNGRYLTLADLGRLDWGLRTGWLAEARRMRAWPIAGETIAKYRRDLKLFQRYTIESRMLGWDDKWAFLEHRFIRSGRVVCVVVMRGLFWGPQGPRPPGDFLRALGGPEQSPPLPAWVSEWQRSCESLSDSLRAEESANFPAR